MRPGPLCSLLGDRGLCAPGHMCQKGEGSQTLWGWLDLRAQVAVSVTQKSHCHKCYWVLPIFPPRAPQRSLTVN